MSRSILFFRHVGFFKTMDRRFELPNEDRSNDENTTPPKFLNLSNTWISKSKNSLYQSSLITLKTHKTKKATTSNYPSEESNSEIQYFESAHILDISFQICAKGTPFEERQRKKVGRPRGWTPRFRKREHKRMGVEGHGQTNRYGRSRTNINYARSNSKLGSG